MVTIQAFILWFPLFWIMWKLVKRYDRKRSREISQSMEEIISRANDRNRG